MSVRMKLTHSKTASRRSHLNAGVPRVVATPSGVRRKHFMDSTTGMYRGKHIITINETASATVVKAEKKAVTKKKEVAVTEKKK